MSPQRRDQTAEIEVALARALQETDTVVGQRDRLLAALDELRQGVLVLDADGIEVFRNAAAERYRDARHADAVVAGALDALISRALNGERCERELQLHSPPRAVVHLSAVPIGVDRAAARRGGVRERRVGDAPGRERAPRLRRQREPRAQDADRRARGAGRDAGGRGRSRGDPAARRAHRQGSRAAGADRRRPARPEPHRDPGVAAAGAGAARGPRRRRGRPAAPRRGRGRDQPAGAPRGHRRAGGVRPPAGRRARSPTSSTTR